MKRAASPAPGGRILNRFAYSANLPSPVFANTAPAATMGDVMRELGVTQEELDAAEDVMIE